MTAPGLAQAGQPWQTVALVTQNLVITMRLLHTMLRVGNLQRSIDFYTQVMGMTLIRSTDRPEQQYTLAFLGYGRNPEHAELELTYNYGVERYELGTAYGHIAPSCATMAAWVTLTRPRPWTQRVPAPVG